MAFGLDGTGDNNHTLVKMGARAKAQYDSISGNTVFNLNVTEPVPASYIRRAGFIPAKAILGRANGSGTATSRATGIQYKKVVSGSFTIPFGAGSGDAAFEFGVQSAILAATGITGESIERLMSLKGDLRKSLIIWGNPSPDRDMNDLCSQLDNCRKLMDSFLDGKLPFQDYLDLMEDQNIDMDSYAETVSTNLRDLDLV